jgi:hypothetical protein
VSNDKIYIHEYVDIIGANRAKYMHHMTAGFASVRDEHEQKCVAVWGEIGTTGNWPRTVNLWEHDGWEGMAVHLELETTGRKRSNAPSLGKFEPEEMVWWERATEFRRGGRDRLLRPTPWSRTVDELLADGVRGAAYAHERIWTDPDRSADYLDTVGSSGIDAYGEFGIELVGAYDNALINGREAIVIWAIPTWATWAEFERAWASSGPISSLRAESRGYVDRFERRLLFDNPLNPMVLGRQPTLADRKPFEEV